MKNKIEIPLSKAKLLFGLGGSMIFVILGVLILTKAPFVSDNTVFSKIVGVASILFFGGVLIYGIRKMFDKRAGLIIDEQGITDHSNATSIGLINWSDITAINTRQVMSTKFLLINVQNPEAYIEKAKTGMQRKLMQVNMKTYGTPISITSNTLNYDFNKLEEILQERFAEYTA